MTWTDEPPTEDGWYWLLDEPMDDEIVAYFNKASRRWFWDNDTPIQLAKEVKFGPRIPTPEELEDTAYVLSRLIEEVIDAGWHPSHVEDAVEIVKRIRKGGDA